MNFVEALKAETNKTTTTNGCKAKKSTLNSCVDLFYSAGAMRGKNIIPLFALAFDEDEDKAIRIALNLRDIRGGKGERKLFRDICVYLAHNHIDIAKRVIKKIPELGRYDDLLVFVGTAVENEAVVEIKAALDAGNGLCAKWMPRQGEVAAKLRKIFGWSPKFYRKTLVGLTNVVEQKMCSNEWTEIDYSKLPSVASARYQKAFGRHDSEGYGKYITSLEKGDVKINAGAVYPYDIVKSSYYGNSLVANKQWEALPNYMEGNNVRILPLIDVSGSMTCPAGGNRSLSCMDVAISLGLYVAEKNNSVLKNCFITFEETPRVCKVSGTLSDKVKATKSAPWGGNTNFSAVFDLLLSAAVNNNIKEEDMPEMIIVFSDMQFDEADSNKTAYADAKNKYKNAGYEIPKMVFWNLNASNNVPAKYDKDGVYLVSGFSPSQMKEILSGKVSNPEELMDETIYNSRYDW